MKNVIRNSKKGILLITMMVTLVSFANDASLFNIKNEAKKTALTLYNVKQGDLLSVKDITGMILYKEIIQKAGTYNKGFDLTNLPDGNYIFELDKDFEISSIPFTVKANVVKFDKDHETIVFKPVVRTKDNLVYVSQLCFNKTPLKVEIYFSGFDSGNYKSVFLEKIEDVKIIEKVYKLTGLDKGSYKIVLRSEGKTFTKFIQS